MFEFLVADFNTPFAIALGSVLILGLFEGLGLLVGLSIMSLFDQFSPFEMEVDVELDANVTSGGITSVVGWLYLNKLPLLVWLVLFLSTFAIAGYSFNYLNLNWLTLALPSFVASIFAIIAAIVMTRTIGKPLAKLMPKNETSAVSADSFTGLVAKVTIGKATQHSPAEAVLTDQFNQKHYVLVAPETSDEIFEQSQQVVLVEKQEKCWLAVKFNA